MRKCLPAAITATALVLVLACGSSDSDEASPENPTDGAELLSMVADAMDNAKSFHVTMVYDDGYGEESATIDWAGENLFAATTVHQTGKTENECTTTTRDGGEHTECRAVLVEVEHEYSTEGVYTEKGIYFRTCEDGDCGGFGFVPHGDPMAAWLAGAPDALQIQLREMLRTPLDASKVTERDGLLYVEASFNPVVLQLALNNRLSEKYGDDLFGPFCYTSSSGSIQIGEDGNDTTENNEVESTCDDDYTFEELATANESLIEVYARNPATLEIWINPRDLTISRLVLDKPEVSLRYPGQSHDDWFYSHNDDATTHSEMEFSRYGEVQVTIPKLNVD